MKRAWPIWTAFAVAFSLVSVGCLGFLFDAFCALAVRLAFSKDVFSLVKIPNSRPRPSSKNKRRQKERRFPPPKRCAAPSAGWQEAARGRRENRDQQKKDAGKRTNCQRENV